MANAHRCRRLDQLRFHDDPPADLRCPNCHQNYDVVASGMVRYVSRLSASLFSFYHCKVCDCRFKHLKLRSAITFALGISLICASVILLHLMVLSEQGMLVMGLR